MLFLQLRRFVMARSVLRGLAASIAVGCVGTLPALHATTITHNFTAVVVEADDFGNGLLAGVISIGDVFTGNLAYDSGLADLQPEEPELAIYSAQPLGVNRLAFSSSTFIYAPSNDEFASAYLSVTHTADLSSFEAEVNGIGTPDFTTEPAINDVLATLYLDDEEGTAFASDDLPLQLQLADFQGPDDRAYLEIVAFDDLTFQLSFRVVANLTQLQTVPEPAAASLLAPLGLALTFYGVRRRQGG